MSISDSAASGMPAELRRRRMLGLLREHEFMRVKDLSAALAVSTVTIRSDLEALAARGEVSRFRGGAVAMRERLHQERPFEVTVEAQADEKRLIGYRAASRVHSGSSLILDVGTTTAAVARALRAREDLADLQIFTNALNIALELERAIPRYSVVVMGGTLRPLQHSLVDPFGGEQLLSKLQADFVFLGCNGVHPTYGVTNINAPEAQIKRRMMASARRTIVVADGSKIGAIELVHLCPCEEVDGLITDDTADPAVLDQISAAGVEVEIASRKGGVGGY